MRKLLLGGVLCTVALSITGCANVWVKKVPLDARHTGKDDHIKGFRYYLTRPYILVKERIPVSLAALPARIVPLEKPKGAPEGAPEYGLLAFDAGANCYRVFDLSGIERPDLKPDPKALQTRRKEEGTSAGIRQAGAPGLLRPDFPFEFSTRVPFERVSGLKFSELDDATKAALNNIQVVHLPDFEEQYAIHNVNVLARTQYDYTFANGTTLVQATGSYDATEVPVKILETIQHAIAAATALEQKRIKLLPVPGKPEKGTEVRWHNDEPVLYLVQEQFIEPGIYRLQKSWEVQAAADKHGITPECAVGLLTELGLPVQTCVSILKAEDFEKLWNPPVENPSGM